MIWMVLGAVGLTIVVVHGSILAPLRRLYPPLLNCALCTGTWVGLALALLLLFVDQLPEWVSRLATCLSVGLSVPVVAYLVSVWLHEHNPPLDK